MRPIDPIALSAKLEALERVIEAARAIAPYRCEVARPEIQDRCAQIHQLLLQAERAAARLRLDLQ